MSDERDLGTISEVLIEGNSKKSEYDWMGRNSQNKVVVFPKNDHGLRPGDYANIRITHCTSATLLGTVI